MTQAHLIVKTIGTWAGCSEQQHCPFLKAVPPHIAGGIRELTEQGGGRGSRQPAGCGGGQRAPGDKGGSRGTRSSAAEPERFPAPGGRVAGAAPAPLPRAARRARLPACPTPPFPGLVLPGKRKEEKEKKKGGGGRQTAMGNRGSPAAASRARRGGEPFLCTCRLKAPGGLTLAARPRSR